MIWEIFSFMLGSGVGVLIYSFVIARDKDLVHLQDDEVIIKRPLPQFVLVQVTPDVARRLVSTGGDLDVPKAHSEARALYPERSMNELKKRLDSDSEPQL